MPVSAQRVADVLDDAAAVARSGWSQWHVALDAHGRPLKAATDPGAVAVCGLGAIDVAATRRGVDLETRVEAIRVFGAYVTNGSSVAQWNADHGTSGEYVAQKLHAAGREHARGGPAHIAAAPPLIAVPGDVPPEVAPRKKQRTYTPEGELRANRGRLIGTLQSQRRSGASEANLAATEGRIRAIDRRLVDEFGATDLPPIPDGLTDESRPGTPLERRPGTESGL